MTAFRIPTAILFLAIAVAPSWAQQNAPPPPNSDQPGAAHPFRIRVSYRAQQANLVHLVEPVLPADVKVTGKVEVHVLVDIDGTVMTAEAVSGDPALTASAVDAVKQWRFRPTKLNGYPVQVDTKPVVIFEFDKNGKLKPQPTNP
jgi:TonB family protein